jgi:hypothetical protein
MQRKLYFLLLIYMQVKRHLQCKLRTEMRDHAADIMFFGTKMKTSFTPFAVAIFIALPLHEKLVQGHIACSEYTKIPVHWHYPFITLQCAVQPTAIAS